MGELSHAELEQYHYRALSNPLYQVEGLVDVLREEIMMNMPVFEIKEAIEEPPVTIKPLEVRVILDKKALELQNRIASLEEKLQVFLDKKRSLKSKYD